jgi:hypothetical protein
MEALVLLAVLGVALWLLLRRPRWSDALIRGSMTLGPGTLLSRARAFCCVVYQSGSASTAGFVVRRVGSLPSAFIE